METELIERQGQPLRQLRSTRRPIPDLDEAQRLLDVVRDGLLRQQDLLADAVALVEGSRAQLAASGWALGTPVGVRTPCTPAGVSCPLLAAI